MSLYKRDDSDVWWVNISVPGQPRIRQSTKTSDRVEAQRIHDEIKANTWKKPKPSGVTWGQAVAKWVAVEERSESELLSLRKFARYFSDRKLSSVTPEAVDKALSFCKTTGTYMRYRTMIAAILKLSGVEIKLLVRREKKSKPRQWLTKDQWKTLYGCLPVHLQPPAKFALATGLRQANVFGLQWSNVDLDRRHVWVEGHDTKADAPIAVPLSDAAVEALRSVQGEDPVWCFTYRGKPIQSVKTAFIAACIRAGVGQYVDGSYQGFTWHGFRHTWATWHIQRGTPLGALRELGGWADLRMVLLYAHHSSSHLASYANNSESK